MKMRNVEIKVRIHDVNRVLSKIEQLCSTEKVIIKQHDTFFKVAEGRLKLRKFEDGTAELIYYKRPNILGPKLCNYDKIELNSNNVELLMNMLSQANGILGIVKKTRQVYIVGQTRIHIDSVDDLGDFVELEVILQEDQNVQTGQRIATELMQELFIAKDDLIAEAYIDLLNKTNT